VIGKLLDGKGRIARKLRISVTDKCNFSCLFCMPHKNKVRWIPQQDVLSFEEIIRITKVLCSLGIVKVRITGGEDLVRMPPCAKKRDRGPCKDASIYK